MFVLMMTLCGHTLMFRYYDVVHAVAPRHMNRQTSPGCELGLCMALRVQEWVDHCPGRSMHRLQCAESVCSATRPAVGPQPAISYSHSPKGPNRLDLDGGSQLRALHSAAVTCLRLDCCDSWLAGAYPCMRCAPLPPVYKKSS